MGCSRLTGKVFRLTSVIDQFQSIHLPVLVIGEFASEKLDST
jgi:hypothetical protein